MSIEQLQEMLSFCLQARGKAIEKIDTREVPPIIAYEQAVYEMEQTIHDIQQGLTRYGIRSNKP